MADKFYVICATPRSGSSMLCNLLASSKVMGNPREVLNVDSILGFCNRHNLTDAESRIVIEKYLTSVVEKRSSQNGVFGMKLLFDQLEPFLEMQAIKLFLRQFKFIWLVRKDVVAQAVSMYIAQTTKEWTSLNEDENRKKEEKSRRENLGYDEKKIDNCVKRLTRHNLRWLEFFSVNQIEYLQVEYENITRESNRECKKICNFCQVETNYQFSLEDVKFKKQGNMINEKLAETFRQKSLININIDSSVQELERKGLIFA